MATALDIITAALQELNVLAGSENPNAEDASLCLGALNRLLAEYQARGCTEVNPQIAANGTDLTLDIKYHNALIYVLADRVARSFGVMLTPDVVEKARSGDRLILGHFKDRTVPYGVDLALVRMRGVVGHAYIIDGTD